MIVRTGKWSTLVARRLKLSLGLVGLLIASLLGSFASPLTSSAAVNQGIGVGADSPFGMNVQAAGRYMARGTTDNYSTPFNPAQTAGIGWDREEFGWALVAPHPGQWVWQQTDGMLNAATSRGINVLGLLEYNVSYPGGNAQVNYSMPDLTAFNGYVSQVVSRYKDRVHYWQIWNEPQDPQYFASASPADYARLLLSAYNTIKSIDPSAKVVTAGFVPVDNGIDWMNQLISQPGGTSFDILAVHPYVNDAAPHGQPRGPDSSMSPERTYWSTTDMNQVSNFAAKLGKPVWATEFGWSTVDTNPGGGRFNHVSGDEQADYITRAYVTGLSTSSIQKFFLYQFHEDTTNPNDRYGIVDTNWGTTKPAFNAYKTMTAQLTGATPVGPVSPYEGTAQHTNLFSFDNINGQSVSCANGGSGQQTFWGCYASGAAQVGLSLSTAQHHSGNQSLQINYGVQAGTDGRYIVAQPISTDSALPTLSGLGALSKIGMWVYGDGNRTILRLSVTDSNGHESQYDMGRMGPAANGWQRYEAQLAYPNPGSNQHPQFPLKTVGIILDSRFQTEAYNGTVYVDDIYAENTPPVYMYRFAKGGQNTDVLWADNTSTTVNLPTRSGQATVYTRDGQTQTVQAVNGQLSLQVSDAPIYVVHQGVTTSSGGGNTGGGSTGGGNTGGGNTGGGGGTIPNNCPTAGDPNLRSLFVPTWTRFDDPVNSGQVNNRGWMWGPPSSAGRYVQEPYDQAPGGCRTVLYWDKSRMEITNPGGNPSDKYFVTNGLLAKELVSGQLQLGDSRFIDHGAAQIPVAGDSGNNPNAPTYAAFAGVTTLKDGKSWQPNRTGSVLVDTLNGAGVVGTNNSLSGYNVRNTNFNATTHHNIPDVFWQFMNSQGSIKVNGLLQQGDAVDWLYSIGLPISEAYWARVTVGGAEKDVLIQVFERRVLTYTPSNPAAYKVEMGNIGQHYGVWRYGK